jgi:hypothetical protein
MSEFRGLLSGGGPGLLGQQPRITDPKPIDPGPGLVPNPYYALFGVLSSAEQAEVQPSVLDKLISRVINGFVGGAVGAAMIPGRVSQSQTPLTTEDLIQPAAEMAGLVATGGLGAAAPAAGEKVLGSGGIRKPRAALPMDEASRMQRARDMGFRTDMPLYYGGAGPDFRAFDPAKRGSMMRTPTASEAHWTARDPSTAELFAEMKARQGHGDPWLKPLLHRSENPARINLQGTENLHEIAGTLAKAWDDGFTSVLINNYGTPAGPKSILAVKDPAQLRSPWATFDPRRKNSRDTLAGLGGATLGAGALMAPDDDKP